MGPHKYKTPLAFTSWVYQFSADRNEYSLSQSKGAHNFPAFAGAPERVLGLYDNDIL